MKKIFLLVIIFSSLASCINIYAQSEEYLKNRILVEGFYIRNLGEFSKVWSKAAGGYLGYGIAFPEHKFLILRTGFISNSLKGGVDFQDAASTIIPLEFGGRYYFTDSRLMPFIQFINGFNILFENVNLEGEKEDKTLFKYSWQIGLGITVNMANNFCVDLGANYQSNFYKTEAMNTGFEYVIGIGFAH